MATRAATVPETTPSTDGVLSTDVGAKVSTLELSTTSSWQHDDCDDLSTMLDISTVTVPDLFDDSLTSGTPFARVKLPSDTSYFERMSPKPEYDTDNGPTRSAPESVSSFSFLWIGTSTNPPISQLQLVTKAAFRHKQRSGGSVKVRPPQATGRWRIKKGRVVDCDDWVVMSFAQRTLDSTPLNTAGSSSTSAPGTALLQRTPLQSLDSNAPRDPAHYPKAKDARLSSSTSPSLAMNISSPSIRIFDASQALYSW